MHNTSHAWLLMYSSAVVCGCACRGRQGPPGCGIPRACSSCASLRPSMVRPWHGWVLHHQSLTRSRSEASHPKAYCAVFSQVDGCASLAVQLPWGVRYTVDFILQPLGCGALKWQCCRAASCSSCQGWWCCAVSAHAPAAGLGHSESDVSLQCQGWTCSRILTLL